MSAQVEQRGLLAALQIRPEEAGRTGLLFLYLFLVSVVFTTGRTARDALFLSNFPDPTKWLSYMWVGYGLASAAVIPLYARLNDRFRRDRFNAVFALFLAASYLAAWLLVRLKWVPIYPTLFIWVEVTSNLLIVQFWTLTNDLHDPREAKRLFGVIGSSRMIGIVVCGLAVSALVGQIGTPALLLVNAGLLLLIAFVVSRIGKLHLKPSRVARVISSIPEPSGPPGRLWSSPYVLLIIAMMITTYVAATVGDYQFKIIAKSYYQADKLAAFFALFYCTVGALAFFFHFFVSSRLLARFGVIFGLLVMPVLMGFSSLGLLFSAGALLAASALKLSDNAFQFTINDASLQLLYYPFPAGLKARLKANLEGAVKPIAYALGGVVLILLSTRLGKVNLSFVVLPVVGLWIIVLLVMRKFYVKALLSSLASRHLEPGGIEITAAPEVIHELATAARTGNDSLFEFAINELVKLDERAAREVLMELLKNSGRRRAALMKLADLGVSADLVRPYLKDQDLPVRVAAIWAYASALQENSIDELSPYLRSAEPDAADAVCAALICFAELDGVLVAGEHLRRLLEGDESARARAARILGRAGVREFYRPVHRLMADPSLAVRREALQAAGALRKHNLIPDLIHAVADPDLRPLAVEALEHYGDRALPQLSQALGDHRLPLVVRERLPRLIRKINRPEAVTALWSHADDPDERLRIHILHHGERLQEKWALAIDKNRVRDLLAAEGQAAARWLMRWKNLRSLSGDPLLREALERALYWCGRRVFSLLRFLYGPDAIGRIRYNLESESSTARASALETLDNLIQDHEREWIVPLLDASDRLRAAETLARLFPAGKEEPAASLDKLLHGDDHYLAALIFRAQALAGDLPVAEELIAMARTADSLLLEELLAVCLRLHEEGPQLLQIIRERNLPHFSALLQNVQNRIVSPNLEPKEDTFMLTTLERVLFLKRVPLFARVPGEDLARLAQESTVETFMAGQDVFKQGDPGDAMFLIVNGQVSVHLAQKELVKLKEEDFFGEMAMLDQEPRSATVTALSSLTALKITRLDFFEIMADRPEIARAIFEVLSKRLRTADEEIRQLSCGEKPR